MAKARSKRVQLSIRPELWSDYEAAALKDGFTCLATWFTWLGTVRVKEGQDLGEVKSSSVS